LRPHSTQTAKESQTFHLEFLGLTPRIRRLAAISKPAAQMTESVTILPRRGGLVQGRIPPLQQDRKIPQISINDTS
jgi:hypothetical protein